jgi:uncharacterized protein (DUF1015 family)
VKIKPFPGYRYATGGDLTDVVAPPYDQISPETREQLYARSPRNVVRVTFPREEPDQYRQAGQTLGRWIADGVFVREERPAIYPYHQTYVVGGQTVTRRGFVALGEVTEYSRKIVLPHERTHAGPKRDRLELLEATGADTGLLFMLVGDPGADLLETIAPTDEPVAEARDLRGELHRLWRISDADRIARIQALMASRPLIIADGHHRYETAVEYARRHPGVDQKLMAFFPLEAPGLTIRPNHRLLHALAGFSWDTLIDGARRCFDVMPLADPLAFRPTPRSIGVVAGRDAAVLRLRDDGFETIDWPPGTTLAWRRLAVAILHEGVLRPLCGLTDAMLEAETHVDYTADQAEAVELARAGRYQAAFLIAATTPAALEAIVRGGELLPPKSTHFYPKLLDGLVFHRLVE